MISKWENVLEKYGFIYRKLARAERAFVKNIGNIQQQIWEQSVFSDGKKILVNTSVAVADPFSSEGGNFGYLPVLMCRLAADGVVIPRSDTGVGKSWKKEESFEALDALVKYAVPWFEENDSPEKLIRNIINSESVVASEETKPTRRLLREIFSPKPEKKREEVEKQFSPINKFRLSLLYYHMGNVEKSCEFAQQWLKHCKVREGEPERTIRQLKELGCTSI